MLGTIKDKTRQKKKKKKGLAENSTPRRTAVLVSFKIWKISLQTQIQKQIKDLRGSNKRLERVKKKGPNHGLVKSCLINDEDSDGGGPNNLSPTYKLGKIMPTYSVALIILYILNFLNMYFTF